MPKPTILFIPGSFTPPEFYDNVINAVAAKGYEIKALHYPSIGLKTGPREGEPPTMYDDATFIATEVASLADEGKDVMLVAHSYGGMPATESTKGMTRNERQKQGKPGGIVRFAYMTVLLPTIGCSAKDTLAELPDENRIEYKFDEKGWMYFADIPATISIVLSDLPDKKEGEALVRKLRNHSSASFNTKLTYAGYKNAPVSYLFCEEDRCLLPSVQRDGIEMIERESGNKVDVTYVKAGHHPTVTAPREVIDWILREAGKHNSV
ncbi:RNA helicase [Hypoxylon texense]